MKNLIFISCFILFLGCNLSVSRNEKFSDIVSLQLKTSFVDLKNKKVDLTFYEGKKIVINHWATWCGPCIKEMPGIERAQKILKNYDYIFLLVSDEKVSKISEFKNDNKYEFNFLKSVRSNETLGIYSLPTTYIFDENGIKIETIVGTIIWDSEKIINKLKLL
jgi:thiol-disulfide isomerase/thioredoxin